MLLKKEKSQILQKIKMELIYNLKSCKNDLNIKKIINKANKKSITKYVYVILNNDLVFEIRISDHQRSFRNDPNFEIILSSLDFERYKNNDYLLDSKIDWEFNKLYSELEQFYIENQE